MLLDCTRTNATYKGLSHFNPIILRTNTTEKYRSIYFFIPLCNTSKAFKAFSGH